MPGRNSMNWSQLSLLATSHAGRVDAFRAIVFKVWCSMLVWPGSWPGQAASTCSVMMGTWSDWSVTWGHYTIKWIVGVALSWGSQHLSKREEASLVWTWGAFQWCYQVYLWLLTECDCRQWKLSWQTHLEIWDENCHLCSYLVNWKWETKTWTACLQMHDEQKQDVDMVEIKEIILKKFFFYFQWSTKFDHFLIVY